MSDRAAPVIESGIPITSRSRFGDTVLKMKIGDSFVCTLKESSMVRLQALKAGFTMTQRAIEPNKVRIWRTK